MKNKVYIAMKSAIDWLLNSGIQNECGGFHAWYDEENKKYEYLYSEVTGYGITTLCNLNQINKAKKAVNWLETEAFDKENGGFRCRLENDKKEFKNWICSFDNAMIMNGLINFYTKLSIEDSLEYLLLNTKIYDFWISMQNEDGSFNAKYDTNTKQIWNSTASWSTQPGVLHGKHALTLFNLYKDDIDRWLMFLNKVKQLCNWGCEFQRANGRFITNPLNYGTYLHPHCYMLEGLLAIILGFGENKYVDNLFRGLNWMRYLGISENFDGKYFSRDIHVDSMAQTVRLWIITKEKLNYNISKEIIEEVIAKILLFQSQSTDPNSFGGFYYGTKDKKLVRHVSAHGTMFALQALMLYYYGTENFNIGSLV